LMRVGVKINETGGTQVVKITMPARGNARTPPEIHRAEKPQCDRNGTQSGDPNREDEMRDGIWRVGVVRGLARSGWGVLLS